MTASKVVQGSAVAIGGRAVLIMGAPGTGKSSLALSLIDRGATLIGDDGVYLTCEHGSILASPPPNITGKLEIRHVGIVDMPTATAPLELILDLIERDAENIPRYLEQAENTEILGCAIPKLALPAHDSALPLRAEWALKQHGI